MKMTIPPLPQRPPVGEVYPVLPSAPTTVTVGTIDNTTTSDWRVAEMGRIRGQFHQEAESRGQTRRKYKRAIAILTCVSTVSGTLAAGCSVGSIAALSTAVGSILGLPLGAVTLTCGLVSVGSVTVLKWLARKAAEHSKIETLAQNRDNDLLHC